MGADLPLAKGTTVKRAGASLGSGPFSCRSLEDEYPSFKNGRF
jgi:hypothetical protein